MQIFDISQRLSITTPVWPGDTQFNRELVASVASGSSVNVNRLAMSTQTGTHAEASRHVRDDGATVTELPLTHFIGPCTVLDMTAHEPTILATNMLPGLPLRVERVLLKTIREPDWFSWPSGFSAIDPDLIDELASRGCVLIGTDAPSIDPANSKALLAHHAVHRAGMGILEGLVLDDVKEGNYELIALPLPIVGAEATPVRAILRGPLCYRV